MPSNGQKTCRYNLSVVLESTLLVLGSTPPELESTRPLLGSTLNPHRTKISSVLLAGVDPSIVGVDSESDTSILMVLYFPAKVDTFITGVDSESGSTNSCF